MTKEFTEDEVAELFGVSESDRAFIRADVDGYRAARREADQERTRFAANIRAYAQKIWDDLTRSQP